MPNSASNSTSQSHLSSYPRMWLLIKPVSSVLFCSAPIADWYELLSTYPTSSLLLSTISFDGFFTEGHFLALHPLACSLPDVCKLWLHRTSKRCNLFWLSNRILTWWMMNKHDVIYNEHRGEEWHSVKVKQNDLQLGHLIFFFWCQDCNWFCILSCSSKFML